MNMKCSSLFNSLLSYAKISPLIVLLLSGLAVAIDFEEYDDDVAALLREYQSHSDSKGSYNPNRNGESRDVFLRGRLVDGDEDCGVDIYPNQSSGVLSSVAWGNVLVRQKSGENIRVNDTVDVLIY